MVDQIQDYSEESSIGTMDIYDSTEPGLALTRAMFTRSARYSDVLTLARGLHGMREENPSLKNMLGWTVSYPGRLISGNDTKAAENLYHFRRLAGPFEVNSDRSNSIFKTLPKIEVGELVGIRQTTESATIPNVSLSPLSTDRPGHQQGGLNFSFDMFKTFGGGILGSPIYFMLNYGHGKGVLANGTTKVPRRWAESSMSTFLCADLPALRESDVKKYVVGNSSTPFRNASSCVMCHATLDPMAYTARNLIVANSDFFVFASGSRKHAKMSLHVVGYRPEIASVTGWPSEPVANFHRQVPTGRLFFRSMTGQLVDKPLSGIASLGTAMTQTKDYYYCAAKRYFEFFTGIRVPLYDRTNPVNAGLNQKLSPAAMEDRLFVEELGEELSRTQSVRTLIKDILGSKYYRQVNFREQ